MAPDPRTHAAGVAGFNVDGRFSGPAGAAPADCAHGDFFSTTDADQNIGTCSGGVARGGLACTGGVDNQLPELIAVLSGFGTDVRREYADQLQRGRLTLLVRVTGVDGTPGPSLNDSDVVVTAYTNVRDRKSVV